MCAGGARGDGHGRSERGAEQGPLRVQGLGGVPRAPAAGLRAGAALPADRPLVRQQLPLRVVQRAPAGCLADGVLPKERTRGSCSHRQSESSSIPLLIARPSFPPSFAAEAAGRRVCGAHGGQVQGPHVPAVAQPGARLQSQVARAARGDGSLSS